MQLMTYLRDIRFFAMQSIKLNAVHNAQPFDEEKFYRLFIK